MFNYKWGVCWAVVLAYLTLTTQTAASAHQEDDSETPLQSLQTQHVATALLLQRHKRQFNRDFNPFKGNNFRRPSRQRLQPGAELIFSNSNTNNNMPRLASSAPVSNGNSGAIGPLVFINNQPTIASTPPFVDPITTREYRECFDRCPTTSEYNPICGNDRNRYQNEQKFNCALQCGANIQVLRRGGCEGLFPMMRG